MSRYSSWLGPGAVLFDPVQSAEALEFIAAIHAIDQAETEFWFQASQAEEFIYRSVGSL